MNETPIISIKKKILATGIGGSIILLAAGWGYYRFMRAPEQAGSSSSEAENNGATASSAPIMVSTEGAKRNGKSTVEAASLPMELSFAGAPRLRRPITFSPAFSPEAQAIMRRKIDASIAALEKDPRVFDEWMNLAILRKTVDDYEGAAEVWEFLTRVNPRHAGPFASLASLYAFDLKDPERAEKNFTTALSLWTKDTSIWRNAYDFYRYVRKDDDKAKQILKDGIKDTQSPDLQYLLDHYSEL
ncbi:MAG: hypothetical protein AAB533_04140 [Patescibacteria group bacterium]